MSILKTRPKNNARGAIQVNTAEKESGVVTDDDLQDFARERLRTEIALKRITTPNLRGFVAEYSANGIFWKEWWLAASNIMIYVTYNVEEAFRGLEEDAVREVVNSIQVTPRS